MQLNRLLFTILLVFLSVVTVMATTWATMLPYVQHTENGTIETHSIPYEPNRGPFGKGETIVYANGKPLYQIDEYFSEPFYTTNEGRYLIAYNFACNLHQFKNHDGNAVNIYKDGVLEHTIKYSELEVEPITLRPWELEPYGNSVWNYRTLEGEKDKLKLKMAAHPAFVEDGKLHIITLDNQLIKIEIETGQIVERGQAYETLQKDSLWAPENAHREYQRINYPKDLPRLKNGTGFDEGLSAFLGTSIPPESDASIQIYIHTLLINNKGKCEIIYASPSKNSDSSKPISFETDQELKLVIEKWAMQQTFQTTSIPKGFKKLAYSGFVYLK